ncbi:hypothetical protein LQW54_000646 [Pestalotiopsis sp. IQ-011]
MSNPLDALINGSMKEAREGVAHLSEEVDEETFNHFFQFAYKGDYEVAGSKFTPPRALRLGAFHNEGIGEAKVVKLWKGFVDESTLSMRLLRSLSISDDAERCWSEIFLAHARVYVFADLYDITPLAKLSKKKLHQALVVFELQKENVDEITILVDYVCANTRGDDKLRELLCRYCAYNVQQLSPNDKFSELLEEHGDFSSAIIKQLLQRID